MPIEHDPRISEIFYYFEKHTNIKSGRTVGRKIGVVQEIIIKKFLLTDTNIRDCLIYEPKLRGKSGATHKVEFVLFSPIVVANVEEGADFRILDPSVKVTLRKCDTKLQTAHISVLTGEKITNKTLKIEQAFHFVVVWDGIPRILFVKLVQVNGNKCRISILNSALPLASLESKRVGAQRFSSSTKLGSGIQTIEKAKQTSLVAIDFDLQFNASMLASSPFGSLRPFRSFALLGNGVHWTDHDLSVLQTYVDYTFQVGDEAIIRYAEFVRVLAKGEEQPFFHYFMKYFHGMTVTPPDAFVVTKDDFLLLRPTKGPYAKSTLIDLVRAQIPKYTIEEVKRK
ncbi:MAG: hypothetical protein P9L99_07705 [Candidatus Lernaella stagnicola]|nr:hypothetical protein [Candidatus Lernaella stagnicola]